MWWHGFWMGVLAAYVFSTVIGLVVANFVFADEEGWIAV